MRRTTAPGWLGAMALLFACLPTTGGRAATPMGTSWNQWLGGAERTLARREGFDSRSLPLITERWRVPLGSGVAGVSVWGTQAVTGVSDGRQDAVVLLDTVTGAERWRVPLGRTRKRAEGTPLGPLSTPAIDAEATYMQALDGRMVCVENATGTIRWEIQVKREFKAFEPGYGFASSPLLLNDLVVVMPAGSASASVAALDRNSGAIRWRTPLGGGTEYASATFTGPIRFPQVVVHVGNAAAGIAPEDGRTLWKIEELAGGMWTSSMLSDGRVFMPLGSESRTFRLAKEGARPDWSSPVFAGVMGPVVEVEGMLVGHHKRRLTALDAATGRQCWQLPEETDGQLVALGSWLCFVNDRAGRLSLLSVDRAGAKVRLERTVMKPSRMETPLAFASGVLYIRATTELIALEIRSAP